MLRRTEVCGIRRLLEGGAAILGRASLGCYRVLLEVSDERAYTVLAGAVAGTLEPVPLLPCAALLQGPTPLLSLHQNRPG